MVIGVTSWPNRLLQRISGCFIHEVAMTTPDQDQRIKIMEGLSKGMSLAKGEWVWFLICYVIDNRVLKRDRKHNNVTSQNTYISIGIPCSTS